MGERKTILVIGDWLVDEHWVVGRHRSDTASRSGRRHSRALHDGTCSVRSLCGAGHVATILHNITLGNGNIFNLIGCGLWNENDGRELHRMLLPENNVGVTPYCLSPTDSNTELPTFVKLYDLAPPKLKKVIGTTRVIRVYEQTQSEIVIRDRLDWERQLSGQDWRDIRNGFSNTIPTMEDLANVETVVVKDLGKGVVTPTLIDLFRSRVPENAKWYISSKDWKPDWYEKLPAESVRLVLVPQMAALQAIRDDVIHSSMWLTAGGHGTKEAFTEIDKIAEKFENAVVVVLPDGMTLFGRSPMKSDNAQPISYKQTIIGDRKRLRLLPMASVFFPALVCQMALNPDNQELGRPIQLALNFTDHWMKYEYARLRESNWKPSSQQNFNPKKEYGEKFNVHEVLGWDRSVAHWQEATEGSGVVTYVNAKMKTLQIWRAMTEINGFVACVPDKRMALKRLIEQGRRFSRERSQHYAFMLMDKPGSGKSYLVKCLARQLGLRMLEFNITQMLHREDLLAMFDKIVTAQAENPDEGLLVFVDEINATINGEHAYSSFLAPLEDGIYVRGGNAVKISPCFWLFAGTRLPNDVGSGRSDHENNKGSDFQSRLTLSPFELVVNPIDKEQMDAASLERNYVVATTIQRIFPDVQRLSTLALRAFELVPPSIEPRGIARLVKTLQNVQFGKVTSRNFPEGWHIQCGIDQDHFKRWDEDRKKGNEGDDIVIESFISNDFYEEREVPKGSYDMMKKKTAEGLGGELVNDLKAEEAVARP